MTDDLTLVSSKLTRWETYMRNFRVPSWEEIPDMGIYMEQMLTLLTGYLDYLPPELRAEEFITSATIHNYVQRKIMPEPVKKKYYRRHLAYLIMICTLKQSLSITTLQLMLPVDLSEAVLREVYDAYASRHATAKAYFVEQVRLAVSELMGLPATAPISTDSVTELITQSALIAGFAKLLAEKLLLLDGPEPAGNGS